MAAQFTPGPWKVHPYRDHMIGAYNKAIDVGPIGRAIATVIGDFEKPVAGPEAEANARLIAAAPDMLAALKELSDIDGSPGNVASAEILARRVRALVAPVITKAEGL